MNAPKEVTNKMNDMDAEQNPETPRTVEWENEDSSLLSSKEVLPEGILATSVTQYRVGKYSYTNLDDAMAEHRRESGNTMAAKESPAAGTPR